MPVWIQMKITAKYFADYYFFNYFFRDKKFIKIHLLRTKTPMGC